MNVLIYTKPGCGPCVKAKALLKMKGIDFTEMTIGMDLLSEDFIATFPEQKSVPFVLINNEKIGGYNELVEYFDSRPQFLAE